MTNIIVELNKINFYYQHLQILEDVDMQIREGDFTALIGPNGGGKTTLIKIILGLLTADSGQLNLFNQPLNKARKNLSYMPQFASFSRNFPITVMETVLQGCSFHTAMKNRFNRNDRLKAEKALRETLVWDLRDKPISQLSGGQLQRVLIARAIAGEPQLLLLDEPTANIDERSEKDIFDVFKALNQRMSILVISHDIAFVSEYVNQVYCLNKTMMCHQTENIDTLSIQQLYGDHVNTVHHHSQHCSHSSY